MENVLLKVDGISKDFGGLKALDEIHIAVESGKITGLIGPNGAGKTTLFNIIAGLYSPSAGRIFMEGERIDSFPVYKRVEMGIARTFQIPRPFKGMSVIENAMIGGHPWTTRNSVGAFLAGMINHKSVRTHEVRVYEYAHQMLRIAGIDKMADETAGNLPHGQQRLLEMARAMVTRPKLLLLDEPAAGLNPHEVDLLRDALRAIVSSAETTIFLVEHDMRLVLRTCDFLYVLDFGKKIAEDVPERIVKNKDVVKAYLGKEY